MFTEDHFLLKSKKGIKVVGGSKEKLFQIEPDILRKRLEDVGFIVFKQVNLSESDVLKISKNLGYVIDHREYAQKTGNSNRDRKVFHVDSEDSSDEILCSNHALPLHNDGLSLGAKVDAILLYGHQFKSLVGGETVICDSRGAIKDIPKYLYKIFTQYNGSVCHFKNQSIELTDSGLKGSIGFINGDEFWQFSLNFDKNIANKWSYKINGLSLDTSNRVLTEIGQHFKSDKYLYKHKWDKGDLLLIDNRFCMHGRNAYSGRRLIFNVNIEFF